MRLILNRCQTACFLATSLFATIPLAYGASGKTLEQPVSSTPAPLNGFLNHGFVVTKRFDAGHGLTGWLLTHDSRMTVVYTTSDGQALLVGNLVDADGHDLGQGFVDRYAPNPALEPAYKALEKATFIAEGAKDAPKRIVYVIFDPNCPYCSIAWKSLRSVLHSGIQVRWVPVAYLKPTSAGRAAAILTASDPAAALATNESGFDPKSHEGAIAAADSVPANVTSLLKANDAIMQTLGAGATPTFVWRDHTGQVRYVVGLPDPVKLLQVFDVSP